MKSATLSLVVALGALVASPGSASAQQMSASRTMRAQVIDTACYINFDLKGPGHKMCAEVCAKAGVALGFLGQDGHIYMASGKGMPSAGQNDVLIEHAEEWVDVTGVVMTRSGSRTIVIDKIERAGS